MMNLQIQKTDTVDFSQNIVCLLKHADFIPEVLFNEDEIAFIKNKFNESGDRVILENHRHIRMVYFIKEEGGGSAKIMEKCRKAGNETGSLINRSKHTTVQIYDTSNLASEALAFAEGMMLGNYQFLKYKTKDIEKQTNSLALINIRSTDLNDDDIQWMVTKVREVYNCRYLVNEPNITQSADRFSAELTNLFNESGANVEVMNKQKIESLKMGGLLGVNKGSLEPPTFSVIEWKPENARNEKPIILVGKGVVFDTGGMNLKPGTSMNEMKSDMAGAAVVGSVIHGLAQAGIPLHVIGLIPATDNRLGGNAIVPGDVLTMHNGMTVEVLNTDAEGRLILADALSYASGYDPELVVTVATLTGIAARAIGKHGIVAMHAKADDFMASLVKTGREIYERIVEFPFWDEYADYLKSEVADIKNIGGSDAGMITAGKFLEKFTNYPFIHLDIAGVAFFDKPSDYFPSGGTGYGVRLLLEFLREMTLERD